MGREAVSVRLVENGGCGGFSESDEIEAALFLRAIPVVALCTEEFRAPGFAVTLADAWGFSTVEWRG